MNYKAVFFDRDGTLTYNDPEWENLRIQCFEQWSGKPFDTSDSFFMKQYHKVLNGDFTFVPYKTVDEELAFFRQWFYFAFEEYGITEHIEERADYLVQHLWYLKKQVYPETIEVLEYLKQEGYKLGVISDSTPSLELTLRSCGIHHYFSSFTASSITGAGKPSPIIYNAALKKEGVPAMECIYVDDCEEEAEGARRLGFTAFTIDRENIYLQPYVINNLKQIIDYLNSLK